MIVLGGWAWAMSSRLAVLETNQRFLMEQRAEVRQLTDLNYKMDKRLTVIENYLMREIERTPQKPTL